jgi:hypothetical protein
MVKEVKENIMTVSHQINNANKNIKVIFKSQMELLELKSMISEMKSPLEPLELLGYRLELTEETISKLEYR